MVLFGIMKLCNLAWGLNEYVNNLVFLTFRYCLVNCIIIIVRHTMFDHGS